MGATRAAPSANGTDRGQNPQALDRVLREIGAFLASEDEALILQGAAGTGKTTLLRHVAELVQGLGRRALALAPTGRTAGVLRERTGLPVTTRARESLTVLGEAPWLWQPRGRWPCCLVPSRSAARQGCESAKGSPRPPRMPLSSHGWPLQGDPP